jgi:hypothetical protein
MKHRAKYAVQERSIASGDTELALKVDETIQLLTRMWMADSERYSKTRALLEHMQQVTEGCVAELMLCLGHLTASVTSQTHRRLLETSTALAVQSRAAVKEEREELRTARQQAETRAGDLRPLALERESARQGEVTESLTARFRDMGDENAELLTQPQVRNLPS